MNEKQEPAKKQGPAKKVPKAVKIILAVFGCLLIASVAFVIYIISGLPSLEELENPKPNLASRVYSADGKLLGTFYIENRIEASIDSIPQNLIDALVATEDRKFYSHWGVDVDRINKVIFKNVFTFSKEGASTITQQLARNLYHLKEGEESWLDTFVRKVREWVTAIQIEKTYTKKEILEMYLNVSYFGRSAYGIDSAARIFFNKSPKDLTVPESALLVAVLKSSVYYDPIRKEKNALERRNLVMANMVDAGYLTDAEYERYKKAPIDVLKEKNQLIKSEAPHFLEYVRQQMEDLSEEYGFDLYRDGLTIYTTLDTRMQKIATNAVHEHLDGYQKVFDQSWNWAANKTLLQDILLKAAKRSEQYKAATSESEKYDIISRLSTNSDFIDSVKHAETRMQTGFIVMEPGTGQIKAMVGGSDDSFMYGINRSTQIRRQPGSSFKPIVYTVAVENGKFPAFSVLNEAFDYNGWSPRNSGGGYGGYRTLRDGLTYSINIVAARLIVDGYAPAEQVIEYARRMGITSDLKPFPSIALGVFEVSPLEMVTAYSTLANKGFYVEPTSIIRIENKDGVKVADFVPEQRQAVSQESAALVIDMMKDVIDFGTGSRIRNYFQRPAAGKTGTTQSYADAWFVGFTPQLCAAVWVGFDDRRIRWSSGFGAGAAAALPIWAIFMRDVYKAFDYPLAYFDIPTKVVKANFCGESIARGDARLAVDGCSPIVTDLIDERKLPLYCDYENGGSSTVPDDGDANW